ncbi:hypothetical protein ACFY3O_02070 [Streptomyces sp. NPDC001046]|uniref:hypothetical protein n=1 Tax=Streptomyces sp. NPDC001046 TaxID=3364543 RepID=UPI0036BF6303
MAETNRVRRRARRLAGRPRWRNGLRLLLLVLLAGAVGLGAAWAGLPQWTLVIGVLACLAVDDVAGWYVKKRFSVAGRPGGEESATAEGELSG